MLKVPNDLNEKKLLLSQLYVYYHVAYAFQSESASNSCLNVKELLARNRRCI